MARITVEDCLARIPNRFLLVNMVSRRVRQIREGSEYLVNSPKNEDVVVALREVAAGKVLLQPEAPSIEAEIEADETAEVEAQADVTEAEDGALTEEADAETKVEEETDGQVE